MHRTLTLAILLATALAGPVSGQAKPLRYDVSPGGRRVFLRSTRTDMQVRAGEKTSRRVTEVSARREVLVVETTDDPPEMRLVTLETPTGERLIAYEEDGQDRLGEIPEARRIRPMPPLLAAHRRDLTGRPVEAQPPPQEPMQAIDRAIAELRYLPPEPVGPDTPRTREMNLGIARLQLTTRQVEAKEARRPSSSKPPAASRSPATSPTASPSPNSKPGRPGPRTGPACCRSAARWCWTRRPARPRST